MTAYERRWETRRGGGRSAGDEARESYYGLPVIHRAPWRWEIPTYFFLGGIAGASYVVAAIADLVGGREERPIVRVGRYVSLATLIPSPLLLIRDLGRPERFHHMLRIFKVRSPMSVGTWGLTVFGAFVTLSALIQAAEDGLLDRFPPLARLLRGLPRRLIAALGAGPALFVSGYTGVLLAATAVPFWTKNYLLMGPLFVASALSNASAAISLILSLAGRGDHRALRKLERLHWITSAGEALLLAAVRRNSGPTIARPLNEGRLGQVYRRGVLGAGLGLPMLLGAPGAWLGRRLPRGVTALAALLTLIGGALLRYLIVTAGHRSADDPQATFELTRARDR
ncbi:MAG: polysulfide reductase NrfD [Sphaerobacter sp.]|nr:polysulfide reductase NrfD [Sphaerobacter sp.]MDI3341404.1 polysulfide reductase NrfD [Sphaerobacter sp.]